MSENPYADMDQECTELPSDVMNWAMLCHLVALLAAPLVGFGHIVGPLVVWLLKRHDHPFIDDQGKESLNFQISVSIYTLFLLPTLCIVVGIPLLIALGISDVVLIVLGAIQASRGETYRYPLNLRLVK